MPQTICWMMQYILLKLSIQFNFEKVVLVLIVYQVVIKSCHQNLQKVVKNQNLKTHIDLKLGPEL